MIVAQGKASAVLIGDSLDQRQAETVAGPVSRGFETHKSIRYPLAIGGRNAGPVIEYEYANTRLGLLHSQLDTSLIPAVLDCIVEKVCQRLCDQLPVGHSPGTAFDITGKRNVLILGECLVKLRHVRSEPRNIRTLEGTSVRARFQPGNSQNSSERCEEAIGFRKTISKIGSARRPFFSERFEARSQTRKRGSQIVSDAVTHMPHIFEQGSYLVEHRVQIVDQIIVFILAAAMGDAFGEIARDDAPCYPIDLCDALS